MKDKLIQLVKGKNVQLCGHWDADGVTSAALIYHLIKPYCLKLKTLTKGKPFQIEPGDIYDETEIIICTDISPSLNLSSEKIVYIDHHPYHFADKFALTVHDERAQSTSLLIYETFFHNDNNPYYIFLALLGYFGDGGNREGIPEHVYLKAKQLIPDMMHLNITSNSEFLEIERYVSALNTGKRMHWSGDVPLELLKSLDTYEPFVNNMHPLARELEHYKILLREAYEQEFYIESLGNLDIIILSDKRNIQGVIAARYMTTKPIMVINTYFKDEVIGSLRVPDTLNFDAGKFLEQFSSKLKTFVGGGHEKAAGFTVAQNEFQQFLEFLKTQTL